MNKTIYCAWTFLATALATWLLGCFIFMEWLNIATIEPVGRWLWFSTTVSIWWIVFGLKIPRWVK